MNTKYYIKAKTGFREDQFVTIPMQEAHKAYYLFLNPEQRGVFSNGVTLIGKNIQEIQPDWNATMGWNATHQIDVHDQNQIKKLGVIDRMNHLIATAKEIADISLESPQVLELPLKEVMEKNNIPLQITGPNNYLE